MVQLFFSELELNVLTSVNQNENSSNTERLKKDAKYLTPHQCHGFLIHIFLMNKIVQTYWDVYHQNIV